MSKRAWHKKRLLILAVILCLLAVYLLLSLFVHKPLSDPEALWPEEGEVIAVIDGGEYCYDLVYLYCLT